MNGAQSLGHFAQAPQRRGAQPSVEDLEDVLYDILATGVDPGVAPGTLEAVQYFLHEHARQRKTHPELLAFFDAYSISFSKDSARSLGGAMSLPPIEAHALPAAISGTHAGTLEAGTPTPRMFSRPLVWLGAACALSVLGAAIGFAYVTVTGMREEIARVRNESAAQAATLQDVQAEAQTLKAGLNQNATLIRSVDHKSELLLQTLVSPLDPAQR